MRTVNLTPDRRHPRRHPGPEDPQRHREEHRQADDARPGRIIGGRRQRGSLRGVGVGKGADRLVPLEQSELLAERLQETGVHYRFVELPWANHSFDHAINSSWRGWGAQITRSALNDFLDTHIGTRSDPRLQNSGEGSSQR